MKSALVIAFVAAAIFAAPASAKEILKVCAKQYNGEGNHNAYFVESTFLSGSELNIATHSMSYDGLSKYVVIFWKQNEASVIKLAMPFLTYLDTDGFDQQGRRWTVALSSGVCF